ncbi:MULTISPECIES: hypothetical protein [Streptomyces]
MNRGDSVIEIDLALLEEKTKSSLTPVVISKGRSVQWWRVA